MLEDELGSRSRDEYVSGERARKARRMRVLFANDPRAYREAMAAALGVLRPGLDAIVAPPESLDIQVKDASPDVVVCSHVTPLVQREATVWIELYPDGKQMAVVAIEGRRSTVAELDLAGLLSIIDQTGARQGLVL